MMRVPLHIVLLLLGTSAALGLHHVTPDEPQGHHSNRHKLQLHHSKRDTTNVHHSNHKGRNGASDTDQLVSKDHRAISLNRLFNYRQSSSDSSHNNIRQHSLSHDTRNEEAHAPNGKHFAWKSSWQHGKKVTVLSIQSEPLRDRRSVVHRSSQHGTRHGHATDMARDTGRHANEMTRETGRHTLLSTAHTKHNRHNNKYSDLPTNRRRDRERSRDFFETINGVSHSTNNVLKNIYNTDQDYLNSPSSLDETERFNSNILYENNNQFSLMDNNKVKKSANTKIITDEESDLQELIGRARRSDGLRNVAKTERIRRRRERRRFRIDKRRQRRRERRRGRRRHNNDTDARHVNEEVMEHRRNRSGGGTWSREKSHRRKLRKENRLKKRRERRERRRRERKEGRSLDIAGLEQENKLTLSGTNACQYRDLHQCAKETELVLTDPPQHGDTIPRCMQRKQFLSCVEQKRSLHRDCSSAVKAIGDLQALRKHIRSAMFTNSSCIIAESITG